MIHEYIITAFKVFVGVVTSNKLMLSALVALGVLFVWMFLSLVFSFQGKFAGNVRKLNVYISRNGIYGGSKKGFEMLVSKMPTEFQRGYRKFLRTPNTLPSDHIKRFESFDIELSGGVFNQNKSVLKTFIHFVFVGLFVFSLAILPLDEVLTGYLIAEASVIPLIFFAVSKIMYYIYTAIRQYQYKVAIEEFNSMMENFDRFVVDNKSRPVRNSFEDEINSFTAEEYDKFGGKKEESKKISLAEVIKQTPVKTEVKIDTTADDNRAKIEALKARFKLNNINTNATNVKPGANKPALDANKINAQVKSGKIEDRKLEKAEDAKVDTEVKRGRGRPKKEVNPTGEFIIRNDKEFEEALLRAEKLMRKNEEPLSASQTKRIEKQIKELVDAMTKYKEEK